MDPNKRESKIDDTHDPARKSWVKSANRPDSDFPIQNLPLGIFRTTRDRRPRAGVAIGDFILDARPWLEAETLNGYMAMQRSGRRALRRAFGKALESGAPKRELIPQSECEMLLPASIGDYTDFYASIDHAMNVGGMFRPGNPLLPNYKHVPVAYHGRSSSIVISGAAIRRPSGQLGEGQFGPSRSLDYELELGAFIGPGNHMGEPVPIASAEDHIVGVCLVNDWSARDIQRWEYQPLGPFLAKNFATSISPWLVTLEALEPYRCAPPVHDVPVLPYLEAAEAGAFDITLEVHMRAAEMPESVLISRSSFKEMYWTLAQMLAHHASNGCPLRPGDLIASGTVSGPGKENRGCLLEQTLNGTEPLYLSGAGKRIFLEDGDEVICSGFCARQGFARIGLGRCSGAIVPAAGFQQKTVLD
jgi:fumarylacetoacetase